MAQRAEEQTDRTGVAAPEAGAGAAVPSVPQGIRAGIRQLLIWAEADLRLRARKAAATDGNNPAQAKDQAKDATG